MDSNEPSARPQPVPAPAKMLTPDAPAQFLIKTYAMVDDTSTDSIVSWGPKDNTFVVWDVSVFARDLLPKHFKHNNFASFVRQLNIYGFHKVDPDRWEFANEGFVRGQKHLLKTIIRRKPAQGHTCQQPRGQSSSAQNIVEVGKFGLEEEVERLKRDRDILMQELVRLRQHQQKMDNLFHSEVKRLQGMELRQEQMVSLLTRAVNTPGLLPGLIQQKVESNRLIGEGSKKRSNDDRNGLLSGGTLDKQIVQYKSLVNIGSKSVVREIGTDCLTPQTRMPGTLQEVPSFSGPSVLGLDSGASVQSHSDYEMVDWTLVGEQDMQPVTLQQMVSDMPEPSRLQMVPESCPDAANATASGSNGATSLMFEDYLDSKFGWGNNLLNNDMEKLPGFEDPFWQDILSPQQLGENGE